MNFTFPHAPGSFPGVFQLQVGLAVETWNVLPSGFI